MLGLLKAPQACRGEFVKTSYLKFFNTVKSSDVLNCWKAEEGVIMA